MASRRPTPHARVSRGRLARAVAARLGVLLFVTGLALLPGGTAGAAGTGPIVGLRLNGVVDPFVADYLRGGIAAANQDGAPAVLLEIDTPGGLSSSMREITQAILGSRVPVICYVAPAGARAASAGAFVLLSCPVAAMAPGTNVGAATPVGISGVVEVRKVTEDATASIRSIAQIYGRNARVAASFVRDAASISAETALADHVIDRIEPSSAALLTDVSGTTVTLGDGSTTTVPALADLPIDERSLAPGVGLLHDLFDPNLAFIFFWLGLAFVVLEIIVPGHIVSGTIGTILLLLAIISFGLLPVRLAGIALLVASVVFFVLELKAPGVGIWTGLGLASLIAGGLLLYNGAGGVRVSPAVLFAVAACAALFFGFAVTKVIAMRRSPPLPRGAAAIVGSEGVVVGAGLGPCGVVRVASEEWRARSPAGAVPAGSRIKVTGLDGLVLTVEPLAQEHEPASAPVEGGTRS